MPDELFSSCEKRGVLLCSEPAARLVTFRDFGQLRNRVEQVTILRIILDFPNQAQIALDRRTRKACANLINELLQTDIVDIRNVQFTKLRQHLAIEEVLIVAMALSGHFLARYAGGLCFHEALAHASKRVLVVTATPLYLWINSFS